LTSEKIGVNSICRQTLNVDSDDWTDLEVGETLHGFCLGCGEMIPVEEMKKLDLEPVVEESARCLLESVCNSFQTAGCDGCGTVSLEVINKIRKILGWELLK